MARALRQRPQRDLAGGVAAPRHALEIADVDEVEGQRRCQGGTGGQDRRAQRTPPAARPGRCAIGVQDRHRVYISCRGATSGQPRTHSAMPPST